jgi:hypothetical protein
MWTRVKHWLSLNDVDPASWNAMRSLKDWWNEAIHKQGQSKKGYGLTRLVGFEGYLE